MAETKSSSAAGQARQELLLSRIYGAPRSLVFKAWTDSNQMARWWGPRGFSNPVCELDVRPGGLIRIDMRGPNGSIYPMKGVFHEIVEPERLVFTSTAMEDENGKPLLEILAENPEISRHLDGAALAKLVDPANYLGLSGEMVDRLFARRADSE